MADFDVDGVLDLLASDEWSASILLGRRSSETPHFLRGDATADGVLDLTDAMAVLARLFLGAGPLPPPGPAECGPDPTPDALAACARGC
jgi:hypothetical protein